VSPGPMDSMVREHVWNLRNDPFYPERDHHGRRIPTGAIEQSLNPTIDGGILSYYFDVYDWTTSNLIRGLSPLDAFTTFPTPRTLSGNGPLLVIISGARQTGLDSLANLILHKIQLSSANPPIVCDIVLEGRDRTSALSATARQIISCVRFARPELPNSKSIATDLQESYDTARKDAGSGRFTAYRELFRTFGLILAPLERPLVIKIISGGDHDCWQGIQESLDGCGSHIIVTTPELAYAKTCYDATLGQNVAWIQARPLSEARAKEFVRARLESERKAPSLTPLFPFTDEAIAALYEPGTARPATIAIEHPVGWLRRTLYQAIEDQVAAIKVRVDPVTENSLAAIDPHTTVIGADVVRAARAKLNRGG